MKKALLLLSLLCLSAAAFAADSVPKTTVGFHALVGGRYDDMRMCVGSPAGVPGGPIMELYFDVRFPLGADRALTINIPLLRPILFGAAFRMLQFEPQISYEHRLGSGTGPRPVVGLGLGAVFHYGPDIHSSPDARGEDFFAAGPLMSGSFGVAFQAKSGDWVPKIKVFYAPLFADNGSVGTMVGGGLELHYIFR